VIRRYSTDDKNEETSPIDQWTKERLHGFNTHRNSDANVTLHRMNMLALE